MHKKAFFAILAVAVLLALNFAGKSHLRRRNSLKVVETVLNLWKNNDSVLAMSYWEKEINSPPIYSLLTYEIGKKEIDKKDALYHAYISATLYFPAGSRSPSGREWLFELNKTHHGWRIVDFRLQE